MSVSNNCRAIVKHFESLHDGDLKKIGLQPKMCPAGIWTIGYGHALRDPITKKFLKGSADKQRAYKLAPALTLAQAEALLSSDLDLFAQRILPGLKKPLLQAQFDALVSISYNIGHTAFLNSTLLRTINANTLSPDIERHFLSWRFATVNGKKEVLRGLELRRKSEYHLYLTGEVKF